jgi:hypothetical protein
VSKLTAFAARIDRSPWLRHLLFLGATLLSILFVGYHFGTFDQAIHIPFLKIYADPTLFPNDPFFDMRFQHYSYFWFFFEPFYKLGVLEVTMAVVHILTTYLAFWGLWTLSKTLFDDALTALLSLVILIVPHLSFAGFPIFEFSLLNRTFAFPFMVWALVLFLRKRYIAAFALMGVMYNLHALSVNFVLAMVLLACLVEWCSLDWRKLGLSLVIFVVTALPVLIWKMNGPLIGLSLQSDWFGIVARGMLYNVFYMVGPIYLLAPTLSGISGIALFFIGHKYAPAAAQYQRTTLAFVVAVILVLVVQIISTLWIPITILIQCQIIRIGFWGVLFGYLYFANYLARTLRENQLALPDWALLAVTCIASPLAFFPVAVWAVQQATHRALRWRRAASFALLGLMIVVCGVVLIRYAGLLKPGIYIYGPRTAWEDAQLWAKEATPKEALFVTPPHKWGFYDSEWRVFSERSTVSTLSELLEAAFVPAYIDYWRPRFEALAPGTVEQFNGDYFTNVERVAAAYYGLADEALLDAAERYGATYVVVEKPHLRPWPVAYENDGYVIYDLQTVINK